MISAEIFAYAVVPGTVVVLTLAGYGIALRATSPRRLGAAGATRPSRSPASSALGDVLPMARRNDSADERPSKLSLAEMSYIESPPSMDLEELLAARLDTLNASFANDDHPILTIQRTICARQIEGLLTSLSTLRDVVEQAFDENANR